MDPEPIFCLIDFPYHITFQKSKLFLIITYMPLSLCNDFLALFICLMESSIAGFVVTRAALAYQQNEN